MVVGGIDKVASLTPLAQRLADRVLFEAIHK
jgi:hypothetical protein